MPTLTRISALPADEPASAHRWLETIAREPLLHFVMLGLLLWCVTEYRNAHRERYTIHVGTAQRQYLASTYLEQFGQPPQPDQLTKLIDRYVADEIRFREGLALGLDRNDEIVRRRIIQKYEFLRSDLVVPAQPTESILESWFQRNRMRYQTPERVSFAQVYFASPVDRPTPTAPERVGRTLALLRESHVSRAGDLGDPFPGPSDVGALTQDEAVRMFGQSEVSEELFHIPTGQWSGPFRSGYGWHVLYVNNRLPAQLPALQEVRERVVADYLADERQVINDQQFKTLQNRYTVTGNTPN